MTRLTFPRRTLITVFGTLLILMSGCATTDRAYRGIAGVVNPDSTRLQTRLNWLTPPTEMGLQGADPAKMVVYLRCKNTSGMPMESLYAPISAQLEEAGYRVTRDPGEAFYTMAVDTRHLGEVRTKDGLGALLTGAAVGGVTGAVIGHNVGSGHAGGGAAAGAVVGGALGNVMASRNKMVQYALAVDIRLGERVKGGVSTVRTGTSSAGVSHDATIVGGSGVESGGSGTEVATDQRVETVQDFLYHSNRIVASTEKLGLTAEEAVPTLSHRVILAVGSVLP